MIARLKLAHLPTPLEHHEKLGVWVKRDDATGGAEAGNKIRKLEYLLAHALEAGASTVITCGGLQSNHARATALTAARVSLQCKLLLRHPSPQVARGDVIGNLLLDRIVGAEIRLCDADSYHERRHELMKEMCAPASDADRVGYIIPEGGSNGRGALGYVEAMREVSLQTEERFDCIIVACGSGGTAAGCALGAAKYDVADEVRAIAVCDDAATFDKRIAEIMTEARALDDTLGESASLVVDDSFKGPAYGVSNPQQWRSAVTATRQSGLVFDPVYSGKAIHAVKQLLPGMKGRRVLYIHTGGLPGLLAQASNYSTHFP